MRKNNLIALLGVLIVLCYVLPYTVLSTVQAWYGSFLLWSIVGVLIVIINFAITKDFEEDTNE